MATLLADANGNLYGTTNGNGVNNYGTVFEVANDANHTLSTLATFNLTNGADPQAGLIADANGNLYGTTNGGSFRDGTVFEITNNANHTLSTLATFNGTNGQNPLGGLIADANGNLYGTTYQGGLGGGGTVFEIANDANHTLGTLATFNISSTSGIHPEAGLIADANGNLYGTTSVGGANGSGTVFEIANDANHTLTSLAPFNNTSMAGSGVFTGPTGALIMDAGGNLYGTTPGGGTNIDAGTVFEVANNANHTLSTLFTFNGTNGQIPAGGVIMDASGNLYGTTEAGGTNSNGTIFELSPVPEPSTFVLGVLAFGLLVVSGRLR